MGKDKNFKIRNFWKKFSKILNLDINWCVIVFPVTMWYNLEVFFGKIIKLGHFGHFRVVSPRNLFKNRPRNLFKISTESLFLMLNNTTIDFCRNSKIFDFLGKSLESTILFRLSFLGISFECRHWPSILHKIMTNNAKTKVPI